MIKFRELFVRLACLTATTLNAAPLAPRIQRLIDASPIARQAFWGIEVRDLDSNATLFRSNQNRLFIPASNTKLFSTALALTKLGTDFRVQTVVTAAALPNADGHILGDLTLVGAGDANLSGRAIPYDAEAEKLDPLTAIRDLAAQLYSGGVRFVDGGIVGDDSLFPYEPYPPGWSVDDPVHLDGAPVSALVINDNAIALSIAPDKIVFNPPLDVFSVENSIVPGTERDLHFSREAGSRVLRLWGTIPPTDAGETESLGVDDPARFAALALLAALRDAGIAVAGSASAKHRYPALPLPDREPQIGFVLAKHDSPPLIEDLRVTDKVSQNLHAEILLRHVGQGSRREGLKALADFAAEAGIDSKDYAFFDGSGLSRLNLVTPKALVQLLTFMAKSPLAAEFASLLPIAGVDGSLRLRFAKSKAKGKVFAKTGSLSHTSALSGYAVRRNGHRLAFSILVNNYNGPTAAIRDVIDSICGLLVE